MKTYMDIIFSRLLVDKSQSKSNSDFIGSETHFSVSLSKDCFDGYLLYTVIQVIVGSNSVILSFMC